MWTIYIIASLLVLLLFTLCIPVDITILFNTDKKPKFSAKLKWLFGLFTSKLRSKDKLNDRAPRSRNKSPEINDIVNILRTRGLFKQLFYLIRRIFKRIQVRELVADTKIGMENPADLGLLFAFLAPFNILVRSFSPHSIVIQPDFSDETPIRGYLYGTARLQPIFIVPPVFGFLLSKPGLIVIKKLLAARWKEKS